MKKTLSLLPVLLVTGMLFGQNNSIHLDGTDDVLIFPTCQGLTANSFTIEGWVKCGPSFEPQVVMMAFQDDISILNANVTLEIRNSGLLRFNYRANASTFGGEEVYSTTVMHDGLWHHFAAVKDNNERLILYIDGFMEAVGCFFLENITAPPYFEIGRNKYDGGGTFRWFHGNVDDFKIWTKAKSPKDIYLNFKRESSGQESGLFSNYKFDVISSTIFDCSPNLRHGFRQGTGGQNNLPQFSTNTPDLEDVACGITPTSSQEVFQPGAAAAIQVYPNPVSNTLNIQLDQPVACTIQVVDMAGQTLKTLYFKDKTTLKTMPLQDIPAGSYLIRAILPDQVLTSKVIKL